MQCFSVMVHGGNFFVLQANFVNIGLRQAASLLVSDMYTGTFLCPK